MLFQPAAMAFVSAWAATLAGLGGQEPAAAVPVAVVDDAVRISEGQLLFRLENRAASPATAWRVVADYALADGTSHRIVYGREGYLAFSGLTPPEPAAGRVVSPGGTTDVAIQAPEWWADVSQVRLEVETAVFADGSAFGPPAEVNVIFARRAADRLAWSRLRAAFEEARREATTDAVARAIDQLEAPGDATSRHHIVVGARKDLDRLINGDPRIQGGRSLDVILADWVRRADAHVAAATRHSTRR